jgi:hypothetical protein
MKNPIAFFTLFTWIVLSGLISACGSRPSAAVDPSQVFVSMPASRTLLASSAISSASVRIVHSWYEHRDGAVYPHLGYSLGTAVGPGVILTHNHFSFQPENGDGEALTFITYTGQVFTLSMSKSQQIPIGCAHILSMLGAEAGKLAAFYVAANTGCTQPQSEIAVAAVSVDAGTQIIHLPSSITLAPAPLGDQAVLDQLAEGEWLTVDYWDEASQRLVQGNFQIMHLEPGVATLSDPLCLIRPGDSGGGVYLNGQLVGNTWAMYTDPDTKRPTGAFNVALVPAEAMQLLSPQQTRVAAPLPSTMIAAASGGSQ